MKDNPLRILSIDCQENAINAKLKINNTSEIFKGHFPDQPIVPGACILQLVKDILESALKGGFILKKADHVKFLNLIIAGNSDQLYMSLLYKKINDGLYQVNANLNAGETICFKLLGVFIKTI